MIEVGEYVRTKRGELCKVLGISPEVRDETRLYSHKHYYLDNKKGSLTEFYISKHSKNIIDLIEVGDIVEIELSEEFAEKEDKRILTQIGEVYTKETLQKDIDNGIITKILTILTKEQYMQNC